MAYSWKYWKIRPIRGIFQILPDDHKRQKQIFALIASKLHNFRFNFFCIKCHNLSPLKHHLKIQRTTQCHYQLKPFKIKLDILAHFPLCWWCRENFVSTQNFHFTAYSSLHIVYKLNMHYMQYEVEQFSLIYSVENSVTYNEFLLAA